MDKLESLLKQKAKAEAQIDKIGKRLGISTGARYGDELADQEFRVWNSFLDGINEEILALKKQGKQGR